MIDRRLVTYGVIFLILLVIALILISLAIAQYTRLNTCATQPSYQCYNDWTCNSPCPTAINACFTTTTPPGGLAQCLYGPTSALATNCLGAGSTPGSCVCGITGDNTCLANCPNTICSATCTTKSPNPVGC